MSSLRDPSSAVSSPPFLSRCSTVAWIVAEGVLLLIILFCALLLALRYLVLPDIDRYRGNIAQLIQKQIGQPVEIGSIAADWDGWNPRLDVNDLQVLDGSSHAVLLALPRLQLTLAWTSLALLDLRFKELMVERPQFALRRDAQGMVHVVGLTLDPSRGRSDMAPANWLLRQRRILIHDATITWLDEQRAAPELTLKHVEFRLESLFGRHRFGLRGAPPPEMSAPIDLRGELNAYSLTNWGATAGRLYVRLDYADVAAWRQWLPMPVPITSGMGALRLWFDFVNGEPRELTADVVLTDVQAKLAPDLPELVLQRLEGRVGWTGEGAESEYFTQQLSFIAPGDIRVDPTDFRLTLQAAGKDRKPSGKIEFNSLQLGPLTQLAAQLPLPATWRTNLASYAPRGSLEQGQLEWQGDATELESFAAKGRFVELGLAANGSQPGVAGLSGTFDATQRGGNVRVQSRALAFSFPRLFVEPVGLQSAQARVSWSREGSGYAISIDQLAFSNAHAAGSANGTYRTAQDGPGTIDLTVQLTRADVAQVYRYLPLTLSSVVRDWLKRSLVSGTATDARLRLSGDLADFPFADGKKGQFLVTGKGQGVTFDYADHWPAFSDVEGDIRFEGARMSIEARRGSVYGFNLSRAKATIADLRATAPVLRIEGEGAGPTESILKYIGESPIGEWVGNFTADAHASGDGKLALQLDLPLGKWDASKANGEYTFAGNRVELTGFPPLNQVTGKLAFTNHAVRAPQLTAEFMGGPARFSVESGDGQVRISGQGNADLGQLRVAFPKQVFAKRVSGTAPWQVAIVRRSELLSWMLESSLKGAVIDLPAPLRKGATETVPLQVERKANESGRDSIAIRYGSIARVILDRRLDSGGPTVERALLALGGAQGDPERPGLWVRGNLDALNVDSWLALKQERDAAGMSETLPLNGIDLGVRTLDVFGRRFNDLHVGATRNPGGWQMDLNGRELAGTAHWQGAAPSHPNGQINARLKRLITPSATPSQDAQASDPAKSLTEPVSVANAWPEIDIVADSFLHKGRDLGRLELTAQPRGADWQIERLQLSSDDGSLVADGWWRVKGRTQQTKLDATLDVGDAGKFLERFGLPGAVRGAPTKIQGELAWDGGPEAFDYPTLSGNFRIDAGAGQFLKLDPGPAKLLGILSLQAIGRRLTFNNQDLFGEGFAFDNITGDVRIQNGIMKSDNLHIVGPAARVTITGETNLARETQELQVHVQPTLSGGVSVGAAALMLANPIIGAAVGAGTLLAQKIMQDPIEQIFANNYTISGTWSEPTVEHVSRAASAAPGGSGESSVR